LYDCPAEKKRIVRVIIRQRSFVDLQVGLAYTIIGILGVAIARFYPMAINLVPPCLFHYLTGIPCPACGATRAGLSLSHLRFSNAFSSNPFFCCFFIGLALWGINTAIGLVFRKNLSLVLSNKEQAVLRAIIVVLFFSSWIYLFFSEI
jgi:hypothetical protein